MLFVRSIFDDYPHYVVVPVPEDEQKHTKRTLSLQADPLSTTEAASTRNVLSP